MQQWALYSLDYNLLNTETFKYCNKESEVIMWWLVHYKVSRLYLLPRFIDTKRKSC